MLNYRDVSFDLNDVIWTWPLKEFTFPPSCFVYFGYMAQDLSSFGNSIQSFQTANYRITNTSLPCVQNLLLLYSWGVGGGGET